MCTRNTVALKMHRDISNHVKDLISQRILYGERREHRAHLEEIKDADGGMSDEAKEMHKLQELHGVWNPASSSNLSVKHGTNAYYRYSTPNCTLNQMEYELVKRWKNATLVSGVGLINTFKVTSAISHRISNHNFSCGNFYKYMHH